MLNQFGGWEGGFGGVGRSGKELKLAENSHQIHAEFTRTFIKLKDAMDMRSDHFETGVMGRGLAMLTMAPPESWPFS